MDSRRSQPADRCVEPRAVARRGWVVGLLLGFIAASFPATQAAGAALPALSMQTLYEFASNPKNPHAGLVQANDGNFYGTTQFGGGASGENGTIFRMTPDGRVAPLFYFDGTNGSCPLAGLIQGSDGRLYGTAALGGSNANNGTIFKITTDGFAFTLLHSFTGADGRCPMAGLVQGTDGSFYGTTAYGGASNGTNGTVFKITSTGGFTPLYSFPSNGRNGRSPLGSLIQSTDGNFYGTTSAGGASGENGTVFKITPSGTFSSLFTFNDANGSFPAAGLVRAADGNFYGTTQLGGQNENGTVFRITPSGALTTLFFFTGPNGNYPVAPLALGNDGNFYGTTGGDAIFGGANTFGTAFRITPAGGLTTLISFYSTNGACPVAGLTRGNDGNFYGTTFQGGRNTGGTIFRLIERPVLSGTNAGGGRVTLSWNSFSNGVYQVDYKPTVVTPTWTPLVMNVTAKSTRTSITNSLQGATLRFYRVGLLP